MRSHSRKTILISGGSGGVGAAIATVFAGEGYDAILLYKNTGEEIMDEKIKALAPGNHRAITCDIQKSQAVQKVIAEVCETYGHIDVVVHAAVDPIVRKSFFDFSSDEFRGQFETSVFGGFNLLREVGITMQRHKAGTIIGITSLASTPGFVSKKMAAYVSAKYALRGLLRELAVELQPHQVTVNAIAPDFMDTALNADLPRDVVQFVKERGTTGSIKTPEDVARVALFLCSDEARQITGTIFSFDKRECAEL